MKIQACRLHDTKLLALSGSYWLAGMQLNTSTSFQTEQTICFKHVWMCFGGIQVVFYILLRKTARNDRKVSGWD